MGTVKFRIDEILAERKLNISDFARLAGLSYPTAHDLATGRAGQIRNETIAKICDGLGIQPGDIYHYQK
jgi:DNA-binding Xre family transcriptional regulator